jgi:hypothetical protein
VNPDEKSSEQRVGQTDLVAQVEVVQGPWLMMKQNGRIDLVDWRLQLAGRNRVLALRCERTVANCQAARMISSETTLQGMFTN